MWFKALTGFAEHNATQVRQLLTLDGECLVSTVNGARLQAGKLLLPSLGELRLQAKSVLAADTAATPVLKVQEIVADVQKLHLDTTNSGALFQVASQFNLLEMVSPDVTPEQGITGYQFDHTQGPACAIACGAGLIYRNYFVPVNGDIGQTAERQLNMLDEFERQLLVQVNKHNDQQFDSLWQMKNGYALPNTQQLTAINHALEQLNQTDINKLIDTIKIGVQYDTQVTLKNPGQLVTQAYCSAMPVAYSQHSSGLWQALASLILQAAYQATLAAGVINAAKTGNNKVYLTLLGGGAFGNAIEWISSAMKSAITLFEQSGLDINVVSYGQSKPEVKTLVSHFADDARK